MSQQIKVYQATITKKDNTKRSIKFIYLKDLPENILPPKTTTRVVHLSESMERVYDIENKGYRTVNTNTLEDVQTFLFDLKQINFFNRTIGLENDTKEKQYN